MTPAVKDNMASTFTKVGKILRKDTLSSKRSKAQLSRMNSKTSVISSKRKGPGAGLKLKIDEINRQVSFKCFHILILYYQSQLSNIKLEKALEELKIYRNTELQRKIRFEEMDELVDHLQKNHEQWLSQQEGKIFKKIFRNYEKS